MSQDYDPHAAYYEQPWHTAKTLREYAREQHAQLIDLTAKLGTCDYLARIERTPGAWRIYGAIDQFLFDGYDADHIVKWLVAGRAAEERESAA